MVDSWKSTNRRSIERFGNNCEIQEGSPVSRPKRGKNGEKPAVNG